MSRENVERKTSPPRSERQRRRRKQLQGLAVALLFFGGFVVVIALVVVAIRAPSPLNRISRVVLGLGAIVFSQPLAESGVLSLLGSAAGGPTTVPEGRSPQRHWYSPRRLIVVAVGLLLITSGVLNVNLVGE
jgi:hypothetical protein